MVDIYLDVCCLNRPFDDQSQERIRLKLEAIFAIFDALDAGELRWHSSTVVSEEVARTRNPERRLQLEELLAAAHHTLKIGPGERSRAEELIAAGIDATDALHLAAAEASGVEVS